MVRNYQNADCSSRKNFYCVIYYKFRHTFVLYCACFVVYWSMCASQWPVWWKNYSRCTARQFGGIFWVKKGYAASVMSILWMYRTSHRIRQCMKLSNVLQPQCRAFTLVCFVIQLLILCDGVWDREENIISTKECETWRTALLMHSCWQLITLRQFCGFLLQCIQSIFQ